MDIQALRGALREGSPLEEPEWWAAGHLVLGSALRLRAPRMGDAEQAQACEEIIGHFERALEVYCQRKPLTLEWHDGLIRGRPGSGPQRCGPGVDGVDLVLEATRSPLKADEALLESAVHQFRSESSARMRETDFRLWVLNMKNYGCALTLLGRSRGGDLGVAELEEAVDAFRSLLKESALDEMPAEQASIHVNLAETLHTLAGLAMPGERLRYLSGAVDSLATALGLVGPARYRSLFRRSQ